jgi:hypothetical protein
MTRRSGSDRPEPRKAAPGPRKAAAGPTKADPGLPKADAAESDPYESPWPKPRRTAPDPVGDIPRKGPREESEFTRTARIRRTGIKRASAGRAIAVGLLAFGIWTLFDANQLYQNALSAPYGARRSVALAILRPIKDVTNAIGLSGPVNGANDALGRTGAETSATLPPMPTFPGRPHSYPNDMDAFGMAPRPHTIAGAKLPTTPTGPTTWPPALRQPSLAHPLVVLDIGDSIGEDLGFGLGDVFAHDPYVKLIQKGAIDTGLARPSYYNWPLVLRADIAKFHPGVVVMMMGANDDSALELPGGGSVPTGTRQWDSVYRHRILLLMEEATSSGSHVVWVGLPPIQNSNVTPQFASHVNQIAQGLARTTAGVQYVSSWALLAGPKGQFVQYKSVNGSVQQIRYPDGLHLAPAGWDLLGSSLLKPMSQVLHLKLHARPIETLR